jgi:hypothetical protein
MKKIVTTYAETIHIASGRAPLSRSRQNPGACD